MVQVASDIVGSSQHAQQVGGRLHAAAELALSVQGDGDVLL
jgi:hypothetical protein